MLESLLFTYEFNLRNARHVVDGLTPEQCVSQPGVLLNHPAWSIGHLALTSDVMMLEMGEEQAFPGEWMERFFPGAPITGHVDDYPPMSELMDQLEKQHSRVSARLAEISPEELAAPPKMELVQRRFSQVAQFVTYAMTGHEGFHLGQIACTRRALGVGNTDL